MKKSPSRLAVSFSIYAVLAPSSVQADQIWDGTGGDNNWNTPANWGLDALPTFTSPITFRGNVRNGAVNNLVADSLIGGINLTNDSTAGNTNAFTLSGNRITLGGDITTSASSSSITDTISLAMILNGNRVITTNTNHNLIVSGIISETGGAQNLTKNGAGTLRFDTVPTFTGTTAINAGTLEVRAGTAGGSAVWGSGPITLSQGATLYFNPTAQAIQNTGGFTVAGPITLSGGAGTANLRFAGNDNKFVLSGGITGQAGVVQTLAISQGSLSPNNGDRLTTQITGAIANGLGGTLGVSVDFAGSSGVAQRSYANLSGANTFTGNLTVTNSRGLNGAGTHPGAWLTIGGLRHDGFTAPTLVAPGTGFLGAGADYSGNISISNGTGLTTLGFLTSANQILRGVISGTGSLHQGGPGTLTLNNVNTFTGGTTVNQGTLALAAGGSGPGIIRGTLNINSGAVVTPLFSGTGWGLGFQSGTSVNTININGGQLRFAGTAGNGGTAASTINMTAGTINGTGGNTFDWYFGNTTTPSLNTLASATSSTISANINLRLNSNANALTFNVADGAAATDLIVSGNIIASNSGDGFGRIIKTGAGTMTVTGANTYAGGTTISQGVLAVGQNNGGVGGDSISPDGTSTSLGSGTVNVAAGAALHINTAGLNIANNITLNGLSYGVNSGGPAATNNGPWNGALMGASKTGVVSNTFSGTITLNATSNVSTNWSDKTMLITGRVTGAGGLVIDNSAPGARRGGLVQLNNTTNDYAGDTTVNNGNTAGAQPTLILGASNVIPDGLGKGNLIVLGNLNLNGHSETVNGLSGSGVINNGAGATTSTLTIGNNNATGLIYSGAIQNGSGTVALVKTGTGTQTLSGANNFSGNTTVSGGTLTFSGSGNVANTANVSIAAGAQIVASATTNNVLGFAAGRTWNISGTFNSSGGGAQTLPGSVILNNGTLTGVSNATFGTFLTNAAYTTTITANGTNNLISSGNFGMSNGSTLVLSTPLVGDALLVNSPLGTGAAQTGILNKTGLGTVTLTGTGSYTGATNVNGGTLIVNGNISTSILTTVAANATIAGSGTVGALTIAANGTVAPGNSPGILNTGNYIQAGLYEAEIEGITAGNGAGFHDQINVTGTVNITGGSLDTIFSIFTPVAGNLIFILLNDGTDAITGEFTGFAQGAVVDSYGGFDWIISYNADSLSNTFTGTLNGNDIALMAVIPEPSTALLGTLGALLLFRRRR